MEHYKNLSIVTNHVVTTKFKTILFQQTLHFHAFIVPGTDNWILII